MIETNGRFLFGVEGLSAGGVEAALWKAGFRPDQPRDDCGRWSCYAGQASPSLDVENVQHRGYFHNFLVDHPIDNLTSRGAKAIKNVDVFGINGILAIPDGATLVPGQTKPYFIEVKTGFDPDFTTNQKQVYPLICMGGHAVSFDNRIRELGLVPGQLLPPLDIMVAHTYGSMMPLRAESFCEMYLFERKPNAP